MDSYHTADDINSMYNERVALQRGRQDASNRVEPMTKDMLVAILSQIPGNPKIAVFWDGAARSSVEGVFLQDGEIVLVADWSVYKKDISDKHKIVW